MKNIFISLVVLSFITSCTNNEVGIKYQLSTIIDGTNLVSNLVNPYDQTLFFPVGKVNANYNVRTRQVIYNSAGALVDQDSVLSESFYDKVKFSKMLETGAYTVVTVTDIVYSKADYNWTFKDFKNLSSANITMGLITPFENGILGFHKELVTITNRSQSLSITPRHLGALYVINFTNVDYSKVKYINYSYDLNPDTYQLSTNMLSRNGAYYYSYKWDNLGRYSGWFDNLYLLPNSNLAFFFTTYSTSNVAISSYSIPLNVVAENHEIVNIDMSRLTTTTTPLSQVKSSISNLNASRDKSISIDKIGYSVRKTK